MFSEYDKTIQTRSRSSAAMSRFLLAGLVTIGALLGFALGLMITDSRSGDGPSSTALFDEEQVTSLFENASPAVVELTITLRSGGSGLLGGNTSSGSGFLVDTDGHIVTNHHVVDGAEKITVNLFDGRSMEATLLGTSPADDLALLRVDPEAVSDIDPLVLGDSDKVEPGQMAVAIGSPFRNFNSITVGIVSGTGRGPSSILRRPIPDMIQTDAPLNPGNSGGPLLNSKGEVIGINSSVRTGSGSRLEDYRIGFAVPANSFRDLKDRLLEPVQVRRPWLGVIGGSVSAELNASLGFPEGIYVTSVFSGSPADDAGLIPFRALLSGSRGDIITAVDGEPVGSVEDMVSYFNSLSPGTGVTLSVFRNDRTIKIDVTLAEWPDT